MSSQHRAIQLALCCLLLAGCHRKRVVIVRPTPPPPLMVSVPPPTHRSEPTENIPLETVASLDLQVPRKPLPRLRVLRATRSQLAGLRPPLPGPVNLGQLTAGGETANGTLRQQTEDLLRAQQRRLAALPGSLVTLHSEQIQQARFYLKQADEAWTRLDLEGARTLATKAKVLLDELPI